MRADGGEHRIDWDADDKANRVSVTRHATKAEALAALATSFEDQIRWCLDEGVDIPEPSSGAERPVGAIR